MSQAIKTKLKPEWELFCQYFVSSYETFGNATRSYAKAYNIDVTNKSKYASCRTQGYRLLTNDGIIARINELLTDLVMNDTTVDQQLAFLIMQNYDFPSKVAAIREYNKLRGRIEEKLKVRVDDRQKILEKYGLGGSSNARQIEEAESRSSEDSA